MLTYAICFLQLTAPNIAGTYSKDGGTVVTTLVLSQPSRYELRQRNDLGVVIVERGAYRPSAETIAFSPDRRPAELSPDRLYVVAWGDVMYLVEPRQMVEFADMAYRRWKGWGRADLPYFVKGAGSHHRGIPVLPSRYRFIQENGFVAKVLRIDGPNRIVINKGSLSGLVEGSCLGQPEIGLSMQIVEQVSKYEAVCRPLGETSPLPAVGDHLLPLYSCLLPRPPR